MFVKYLILFFISMVPIVELRGAIPYSVVFGLPLIPSYIICVIGNMLPVPFIYLFARKILIWGSDKKGIGKFFRFCLEKGEKGRTEIKRKSRTRYIRRTASLCWYSAAGHRCMDRYTRCQSSRYGF